MDRIYDILRNVEENIKQSSTLLPVPTVDVGPAQDPKNKLPIKPKLVDQKSVDEATIKQKDKVKKLQVTNPNTEVSRPNGDESVASSKIKVGDKVKNIDQACMYAGSEGIVKDVQEDPVVAGYHVGYTATNSGQSWTVDQYLRKSEDHLALIDSADDYGLAEENESPEDEMKEYKNDFLEMNMGSLRAIMHHAHNILEAISNPSVKENLTESWLQGKIAITEDYMRTIHDFVMYVSENDDDMSSEAKKGLWDNIRQKKEKEGKDYKPAQPGDKDRPDPEMWKKLTKDSKKSR